MKLPLQIQRKQLKSNARAAIRAGKGRIVWIGLVYGVLVLALTYLSLRVSGDLAALQQMLAALEEGSMELTLTESTTGSSVLTLAIDVMVTMLGVGFVVACLATARSQRASVGNLFDGFACFLRALGVTILKYLIASACGMIYVLPVSLLMLLGGEGLAVWAPVIGLPLLAPALRTFYSYRLAVYLLLDRPELSAFGCMHVSRRMMAGRRWELFRLDLSFIGWMILGCAFLPAMVWVLPYMQVCFAGYYDALAAQCAEPAAAPPSQGPEE